MRWVWVGSLTYMFWAVVFSQSASAATRFRLDPHYYSGTRGAGANNPGEPQSQLLFYADQNWQSEPSESNPWRIRFHFESETQGRRDYSIDIDRAYYGWSLSDSNPSLKLILGRVHPYDFLGFSASENPWGLLAQRQAQSRGVLLGYGWNPDRMGSQPLLLGWIGSHLLFEHEELALGVSITPVFLPSLGSELTSGENQQASVGRFGRRPPYSVDMDGRIFPVRFNINRERLIQDVVLQPQAMVYARYQSAPWSRTWLHLSRSPSPDPTLSTDGFLKVENESVTAIATVTPNFPQRVDLSATQEIRLSSSDWSPRLRGSLYGSSDHSWGTDFGFDSKLGSASVLKEWQTGKISNPYTQYVLLAAEARVPMGDFQLFLGMRGHPGVRDVWLQNGVRWNAGNRLGFELGTDVFAGGPSTYFGEWRTNDRAYAVVTWGI